MRREMRVETGQRRGGFADGVAGELPPVAPAAKRDRADRTTIAAMSMRRHSIVRSWASASDQAVSRRG
jgi:hypothetical protein